MALLKFFPELKQLIVLQEKKGRKVGWQFKFSNRLSKLTEDLVLLQASVVEGQQVSVEVGWQQGGAGRLAGQVAGQAPVRLQAPVQLQAGWQQRPGQGLGLGVPSFQGQLRLLGRAAGKGKRDRAW